MRRSSDLRRLTPLIAKSPLRRAALNGSPLARSALHANQAVERRLPKRQRDTGPSAKVRALVAARSGGWCEWSGCWVVASDLHHRLGRKAGGRRGEASVRINQPSNLLAACRPHHDAVTSPVGAALEVARSSGWLLRESDDALTVPVLSRHGLVLLGDDGKALPYDAKEA